MSHHTHSGTGVKISTPSDLEIVTERVFDAPREQLYAAFTDPSLISQWWGLRDSTTTVDKLDLRPGGEWRFVERSADGSENGFHGAFREVSPPERIAWTFEWEGMPGHVLNETVTFEDLGGRTNVKSISVAQSKEDRDGMLGSGMEDGMNQSYERLDELLSKVGSRM